jgi:glucan 1,3-beta-glucosidase
MNFKNVKMDQHSYVIFDPKLEIRNSSVECHAFRICQRAYGISAFSDREIKTVFGEWSGALNDCTRYLNGYKAGNRYEGGNPNN